MKEFKGTPGPWVAIHNGFYFNIKPKDSIQSLADTEINEFLEIDAEVEECNANLIAAAPDLLAAVNLILELQLRGFIVIGEKHTATLKSAIARALGEG